MSPTYTVEVRYRGRHIGWMDRDEPEVIDAETYPHGSFSFEDGHVLPLWKLRHRVRDNVGQPRPVREEKR